MDNVIQFPRTFAVGTLDGMTARKDARPIQFPPRFAARPAARVTGLTDPGLGNAPKPASLSKYVERREGAAQTIVVYLA